MIGRKTVVGICILCALVFSALGAQGAHAETKGTTLFTCKKPTAKEIEEGRVDGEKFSKAHCKDKVGDSDTSPTGEFRHVTFAENTTTELTGTSENTEGVCQPSILRSTQSGIETELKSTCSHILPELEESKSWVTNKKDPTTGEHYYEGTAFLDYTNVTVPKPAGKGCKVKGETIIAHVKFTTLGQGDNVKFEPATGMTFASFEIEGCTIAALNGVYEVKGSIKAEPNGATISTTEEGVTAQGTLTLRGQKAGLEGEMTVKGTDKAAGDLVDTPLSPTTVVTP